MSDAVSETAKWAREALAKKQAEEERKRLADVLIPVRSEWFSFGPADQDVIDKP